MSAHRILLLAVLAAMALPAPAPAQDRRSPGVAATSPLFEYWSFGNGIRQRFGGGDVVVERVTQWSVPLSVIVPIGSRWSADVSGAYSSGQIRLAGRDSSLRTGGYALTGLTDVKVRLVGRLVGDNLLFTIGANAPTGRTTLDQEALSALAVLAAPALRLQSPALGLGPGGTVGLVIARPIRGWAWALAGSYEHRGSYAPVAALVSGAPDPTLDPGEVVHLSLGTDGLLGEHGLTLSLTGDLYSADAFVSRGAAGPASRTVIRLGPTGSAELTLRIAAPRMRELTLYAVDRYRSAYRQDGRSVAGSSGNQLDAGARAVVPLGRALGLMLALDGRHHTGLDVDDALATAAYAGGGASVGLDIGRGAGVMRLFGRAQLGRIVSGDASASARGVSAGVAYSRSY